MKITGQDIRLGEEFQFTKKPTHAADATFVTVIKDEMMVTRRASDFFHLRDDHPVLAHRHGQRRTVFDTTVGELKRKAEEFLKQGG